MPYGWQPASTQKKKRHSSKEKSFSLLVNIRDTFGFLVVKETASFLAEVWQVVTCVWFDSLRNPFLVWFCGRCSYFINVRKLIHRPLKPTKKIFTCVSGRDSSVPCYVSNLYSTKEIKNQVLIVHLLTVFRKVLALMFFYKSHFVFPCDKLNDMT
jgi:hypothetical protein